MLIKITSASLIGIDALPVDIEIDVSLGLPGFTIVGLPDASVRESKDRVRAALKNCGYKLPSVKIIVNLAPADRKKEGSAFDLPISVGLLAYMGVLPEEYLEKYLFLGELALDGRLKPVRGGLAAAVLAEEKGFKGIVLPRNNEKEAALVRKLDIFGLEDIVQVVQLFNEPGSIQPAHYSLKDLLIQETGCGDFCEIKGQQHVKRALEVAAAGGHNVLLIGPPGAGKTMLARHLPSILPPLRFKEIIEVTRIYSALGLLKEGGIMKDRPFRSPHHTITDAGLIGGGLVPRPGEVTLAHHGVLFLDELPEFRRKVLEDLRQPLEDGCVTVSRASAAATFPSSFMLVAAMNPYEDVVLGEKNSSENYYSLKRTKYYSKISGPLLDRIDIHVEVPKLDFKDIVSTFKEESSREIRKRVASARKCQTRRFKRSDLTCNDRMGPEEVKKYCRVDREGRELLAMAVDRLGFSARGYTRVLKVARTIADLEGIESILSTHIAEAVQYRMSDQYFPSNPLK